MSFGRPEIWIRTHAIQYRSLSSEPGAVGTSYEGSASLPSTPLPASSASLSSSSRKHAWSSSSSGVKKRSTSAKLPPPSTSGAPPRVTRSTSARAASSSIPVPLPRLTKRSSAGGVAGNKEGAEASPQSEVVKEKERVALSPLHQALLDCVKAQPGKT